MRQRDPLTADEHRELEALDLALAGERVDDDLLELARLVHDVRADAPQMSPGFAARLEHQAAEGFPASQERPPVRRRRRRWMLLPAAGTLVAALAALVVVLGGDSRETSTSPSGSSTSPSGSIARDDGGETVAREAAPNALAAPDQGASESADRSIAPAPPVPIPGGPIAPSTSPRKVQRSVTLALSVAEDDVQSTADDVVGTVDRFGGIVASSSIGTGDETTSTASFDLRIPTARLDEALAALSKLGHVAERRQELADITGSLTSVSDRLSDARSERKGLQRALGRASSQAQIDSLKSRLRGATSRVSRLKGDLEALRRRANLATVGLTVRGDADTSDDGGATGGHWTPGDAAGDALRVLEVVAGVALIALAVLAPLALLGALGAVGLRAGRRRRRESTLDTV